MREYTEEMKAADMTVVQHCRDHTDEALEELDEAIAAMLTEMGIKGEDFAKQYCPVDTGRLRNSITWDSDGEAVYIGTNVEYAEAVEMGTSRRRATPYLQPAVSEHVEVYKSIAKKYLPKGK